MTANRLLLAVTAVVLGACSEDQVAVPPPAPTGAIVPLSPPDAGTGTVTERERALPERWAAAMSSQSDAGLPFAALGPLLNEDLAQFNSPGMPPAHETSGIVAAHAALFGAFDDRKMAVGRVWRTASEQTFEWTMTGVQARDWRDVPATHRPAAFKGLTLMWTKDDGSITDIHVYLDMNMLKAQLTGVGPKDLLAVPPPTPPSAPQFFDQSLPPSADEQRDVDDVKGWLDALENNKEADYLAAVTDDVEINTLETATPAKGKEEVRKYYRAVHRAVGQLDTTINNVWGVAQYVVVEYDIDGDQLGPITWIPSLAPITAHATQLAHLDKTDICEMRDGKIARIWRYDNPAQMLGLGQAPPMPALGADAGAKAAVDAGARADGGKEAGR